MATEKTKSLSSVVVTAITFNSEPVQPVYATGAASDFTAEEVVKPKSGDARKAIEVIEFWKAAEAAIAGDNKHMPPLSKVLHNSLVVTKGYESNIIHKAGHLPQYPQGHLETRVTTDYVAVTSVISEADQQHLLAAPKFATASTDLVQVSGGITQSAQGPVKLWEEPKQVVHTIGFSLPQPEMLAESTADAGFPVELFSDR